MEVSDSTHQELVSHAEDEGPVSWATIQAAESSSRRVGDMLALIAATTEYQFG